MSRAIPPPSQYAFMAWCSVTAQGQRHIHSRNVYHYWVKSIRRQELERNDNSQVHHES